MSDETERKMESIKASCDGVRQHMEHLENICGARSENLSRRSRKDSDISINKMLTYVKCRNQDGTA